ncbi:hypothetical protein HDU98_010481 [Podochytrium sp. JEL0797]|nr:hypothetical protein HDU98_010481 [Podochytrium sp. JEL0797]
MSSNEFPVELVTCLNLKSIRFSGELNFVHENALLSPSLNFSNLVHLREIELGAYHEPFPTLLTLHTSLTRLSIVECELMESLPAWLSRFEALTELNNSLSGRIPVELGMLVELRKLDDDGPYSRGTRRIAHWLMLAMLALVELNVPMIWISDNYLSGPAPEQLREYMLQNQGLFLQN